MIDFKEMRGECHMPVSFGPTDVPLTSYWEMKKCITVKFVTDGKVLQKFLPPMLTPLDNTVNVYENQFENVNLIAGRGYNFFGISVPVKYVKNDENITGTFIPACWVNDGYAMMLGREGAGYPKLFANVTNPTVTDTGFCTSCSEYDHKLIEIEVSDLKYTPSEKLTKDTLKGTLFLHKKICGFGDEKEVDYVTVGGNESTLESFAKGKGKCTFFDATWEQAPASYNVMKKLRELPILEYKDAVVSSGKLWNYGSGIGRSIIK